MRLMKQSRAGHLAANAKCHQCDGMGVHDRENLGARFVDRFMKWKLRRRRVQAIGCPIGSNADNVLASQVAFVDAGRRNPDIAISIANRKITAGGRCHPVTIDSIHRLHDLVTRMEQGSR
jgi:hypothetical protein